VWIIVLALICPLLSDDPSVRIRAVAWGVVVAGVLQAATLAIPLQRLGVNFGLDFRWHKNPRVIEALKLMAPTALGMGVLQINVCVDGLLAMWAAPWAPAALEYAERLVYLPLGIVGTAFVTVLLPTYSRSATNDGGTTEIRATLERALRDTTVVMAPAAIGLFVLAMPVTQLIYGMGEFNDDSALRTSRALAAYAPGLFVFMLQKTTTPVFYALKMPRIPMISGIVFVCVNFCFNLLFVLTLPTEWKHVGIAGSTGVTSAMQGFVLTRLLRNPIGGIRWRNVLPVCLRVLLCAAMMGAAVFFANSYLANLLLDWKPKLAQAVSVLVPVAVGAAVYFLAMFFLCRAPLKEIVRDLRPRQK
jgi:putative peptidoglycan lipid II flippase